MTTSPLVRAAARRLRVDATTAEVLRAFEAADCRSIVLKGPVLRLELYRDGRRSYGDTDLLVSPADLERAGAVLEGLGFGLALDDRDHVGIADPHAQVWKRANGEESVDLHWCLPWVGAEPERTWEVLSSDTMPVEVGRVMGRSLAYPGVALLVALHAAVHGTSHAKPGADLERALDAFDPEVWRAAARLADELDARDGFAAGLGVVPAGRRLAQTLELPAVESARLRLIGADSPPGALGLNQMLDASRSGGRARAALGVLFPAPTYMRATSALARRGAVGLVGAYFARAVTRAPHLPRAIAAVRRARAQR